MSFLFVSDLHYSLKQFDWLLAQADGYEMVVIGGDLLDMGSDLDTDVQIAIVEKYLDLLRKKTTVVVCSGNHDGDAVSEANESFAEWLREARDERLYVDGDSFDVGETRVTVCPWWNGEVMRREVEAQLVDEATRVRGKWIWVYHAPPEGARTSWAGRRFIGDDFLKAMIERFSPDMVLRIDMGVQPGAADWDAADLHRGGFGGDDSAVEFDRGRVSPGSPNRGKLMGKPFGAPWVGGG
jgi:Icc-related predicted phosphoesterase